MKLTVWVSGREVGTLEAVSDFKSVFTYHPACPPELMVSLTMPVRTQSYEWDDQLPPVFQMNLPEGYLLQVLQEAFGPHIGASPLALLAVIGRNLVGRMQVTPLGTDPQQAPEAIDVADLLQGDNAEHAFAHLVRRYATSGVSGVMPKFLAHDTGERVATTLITAKHIIKGPSAALPHAALNEYFCLEVARRVVPTAKVRCSNDGHALVVDRFDVDARGRRLYGMEDFCSLLGLRAAAKYETTWERIAKAIREYVPAACRQATLDTLAATILLSYALQNADYHAKNLALLYTGCQDVTLAPVYDVLTTSVYPSYQDNPPAISFMGKKTWEPGRALPLFLANALNVLPSRQKTIVESIGDAIAQVAPDVRAAMRSISSFHDVGARMLRAWLQGLRTLHDKRHYAVTEWQTPDAFDNLPAVSKLASDKNAVGRSELLGKR